MKIFTDQLNRKVTINATPQRIVSLVPSQTELLYDIGLRDEVVGITKFCIHPRDWFQTKTRVGGTKKLNMATIRSLNPDLIIGNKEENDQTQIEELINEYPVWMSDVKTFADAKRMMIAISEMVGKFSEAMRLIKQIDVKFDKLMDSHYPKPSTVAYFIWHNPMMVAGNDTFINEMLVKSGFENVISRKRYPEIDIAAINELKPDFLFLSSEPFPFNEKYIAEYQKLFPFSKPVLVDGEMFSWYGSRLLKAPDYFQKLRSTI